MNSTDPRHPWSRLTAAARTVPDSRDTAVPYGFATRVTALAFAQEQRTASALERFSLRALGIACLLTMATGAANYSVLANLFSPDEPVPMMTDDPVAELVDVASS
jgi:uncharacterized membrane protein